MLKGLFKKINRILKGRASMIRIPKVICQSNGARVCLGRTEFGQYAPDTDEVIYER